MVVVVGGGSGGRREEGDRSDRSAAWGQHRTPMGHHAPRHTVHSGVVHGAHRHGSHTYARALPTPLAWPRPAWGAHAIVVLACCIGEAGDPLNPEPSRNGDDAPTPHLQLVRQGLERGCQRRLVQVHARALHQARQQADGCGGCLGPVLQPLPRLLRRSRQLGRAQHVVRDQPLQHAQRACPEGSQGGGDGGWECNAAEQAAFRDAPAGTFTQHIGRLDRLLQKGGGVTHTHRVAAPGRRRGTPVCALHC